MFEIEEFGWRNMIFSVGIGFWVLGLPTSLILRGDPEDYGQYPDGEKRNNDQTSENDTSSQNNNTTTAPGKSCEDLL